MATKKTTKKTIKKATKKAVRKPALKKEKKTAIKQPVKIEKEAVRLPDGWHLNNEIPTKKGIYKSSRFCVIEGNSVMGNGYFEWNGSRFIPYKDWGNHINCADYIWFGPCRPSE